MDEETLLLKLQASRGHPVVVFGTSIDDESIGALYECLMHVGHAPQLDIMLTTPGGAVGPARRMALLLREFAERIAILIPCRSASAGTLVCLSADELVMGPMGELGPIDPLMSEASGPPGSPTSISAEDVRRFRSMAEGWFGVRRRRDRLQVLALMSQKVFPPTLTSLYRYDALVRQIARELLVYGLPGESAKNRDKLADHLIGGYGTHDHSITRREARTLGLPVTFPDPTEEALMWKLARAHRDDEGVAGVIASSGYRSEMSVIRPGDGQSDGSGPLRRGGTRVRWTTEISTGD